MAYDWWLEAGDDRIILQPGWSMLYGEGVTIDRHASLPEGARVDVLVFRWPAPHAWTQFVMRHLAEPVRLVMPGTDPHDPMVADGRLEGLHGGRFGPVQRVALTVAEPSHSQAA